MWNKAKVPRFRLLNIYCKCATLSRHYQELFIHLSSFFIRLSIGLPVCPSVRPSALLWFGLDQTGLVGISRSLSMLTGHKYNMVDYLRCCRAKSN